jgi:lysophospholipase L1-like esterase
MVRRTLLSLVTAGLALIGLIGIEVVITMRRDYLHTEPVMDLGGTFGPPDGVRLRFAVLGDSTAAGLGAGSPEFAYPTVLARMLAADGYRVELTVLGVSGARTADVLDAQVPRAEAAHPDLVFIGIGANDAIHLTSLDRVRHDMSRAIHILKSAGIEVVVGGAPDMRAAAFLEPLRSLAGWRGREVERAIGAAAAAEGAPVAPLRAEAGPYFATHPEDAYAADDFHPGAGGYKRWAEVIYPVLTAALAAR